MRLKYKEVLSNVLEWMTLFGDAVKFESDIGTGFWIKLQPNLAVVLSIKEKAFFIQLLRGKATTKAPAHYVKCLRNRTLTDSYPCIKNHITVESTKWNRKGEFHISIYEDKNSTATKLLFDLYYYTCFPKWHPQRIKNPSNFTFRVVHIYFEVDKSHQITVKKTHPEGKCVVLLDKNEFSKKMFELLKLKYQKVNYNTLEKAWEIHNAMMEDVRTMMQVFGHIVLPMKDKS